MFSCRFPVALLPRFDKERHVRVSQEASQQCDDLRTAGWLVRSRPLEVRKKIRPTELPPPAFEPGVKLLVRTYKVRAFFTSSLVAGSATLQLCPLIRSRATAKLLVQEPRSVA